jgi:hypothetical protein
MRKVFCSQMDLNNLPERIRTIEFSGPEFDQNGARFLIACSPALEDRADISVFVTRGVESRIGAALPPFRNR